MARTSRTGTRTDLALLGVALACAGAALILPTAVRSSVQGALRSSIVAPLVSAQAWAERGRQAIGDHGRLVGTVDSLSLGMRTAEPLRAENDRLRKLLGLGQRLEWGFVATELLHPPRGGDEHTVLLAAGSAAGVRPFSPVVVPEGLIGMVTSVDASSSSAILWTHPDFRASATTTDGVAFGIVAAHLGTGADRFLLEMRGVPFRSELKPGTMIVTSGLGNVFPRGIPIGVVLRETKTIEGWARTYLLRPIVSPDASSLAMVLLPPRAAAGVTDAWSSAAASEGAQKSIAAAGDSLIADSVRQVQAKLALLDSLRRLAIYRGDSGVRVEADTTDTPARTSDSAAAAAMRTATPAPVTPAPATVPAPATPRPTTPSATVPAPVAPKPTPSPATANPAPVRQTPPAPSPTRPTVPATGTAGATSSPRPPAASTPANATPRVVARPPARRDSVTRSPSRTAAVPRRATVDSSGARNRVRRDTTKAPENPFRLPPAGGRE